MFWQINNDLPNLPKFSPTKVLYCTVQYVCVLCVWYMCVLYNMTYHFILQVVTVTENVKFSQSALSAAGSFKRVCIFYLSLYPK